MEAIIKSESMKFAWFLMASSAVPLVVEVLVGGEVETPIPWRVLMLIAVHLMSSGCRPTLVLVVLYSWMSFLVHLQPGVSCLLPSSAQEWLEPCEKGGLVQECRKNIETLNRLKRHQENCPHAVLGHGLGTAYLFLVYTFRFVPCCILSAFKLFRDKALRSSDGPMSARMFVLSSTVVVCCILEMTLVNVRRLSTLEVILPFVFAFQQPHGHTRNKALNLGIFYTMADFFMNSLAAIFKCAGSSVDPIDCENGIGACLQGINDLPFLKPEDCPSVDFQSFVLYLASIVKVCLLTAGIVFTYTPPGVQSVDVSAASSSHDPREETSSGQKTSTLPTKN